LAVLPVYSVRLKRERSVIGHVRVRIAQLAEVAVVRGRTFQVAEDGVVAILAWPSRHALFRILDVAEHNRLDRAHLLQAVLTCRRDLDVAAVPGDALLAILACCTRWTQ